MSSPLPIVNNMPLLRRFFGVLSPTVIAGFMLYVYELGYCSANMLPPWFARPDYQKLYPFVLVVLFGSICSLYLLNPPIASTRTPRGPSPRFDAFFLRALVAVSAAIMVVCFYISPRAPSIDWTVVASGILLAAVLFVLSAGSLLAMEGRRWLCATRFGEKLMKTRLSRLMRPYRGLAGQRRPSYATDNLVRAGFGKVGVICAGLVCIGWAYAFGGNQAAQEDVHLVVPGPRPEIVLAKSGNTYITGEWNPKTGAVTRNFRWHDIAEHQRLDMVETGRLTTFLSELPRNPDLMRAEHDHS